jgi:staphylococcal nuclease domain-containing protein 1
LALLALAPDEDYAESGLKALRDDVVDHTVKINVEYRDGNVPFVTLTDATSNEDIGKNLVTDGLMMVDKKGGRRLAKLVNSYIEAQDSAKKNHLNIWEYGDITADDAREFGAAVKR